MTDKEGEQFVCAECGGSIWLPIDDELHISIGCIRTCDEITKHTNLELALSESIQ